MMLKKSISVILAIILAVSVFTVAPLTVYAEEIQTDGNYQYAVVGVQPEEGETVYHTELVKYTGDGAAVNIPSSLGGYDVTVIRDNAFYKKTELTSVNIPDTVTLIGNYAFGSCSALEEVRMSENLEELGYAAFRDCKALTAIKIPDTFKKVNNASSWGPFTGCDSRNDVTIESGLTEIPEGLFAYCSAVEPA